jgi:hypothetical protein
MSRRLILFALAGSLLPALLTTPGAHAATADGHLNTAQFALPVGVTGLEWVNVDKCASIPTTQGEDAFILSASGATKATVVGTSPGPTQQFVTLSIGFFDGSCNFLGGTNGNSVATATVAPGKAKWIYVYATNGADITLSITWS